MIGLLELELLNNASHSLKEKRRDLKRLMDQVRTEFRVAVAEVEGQDTWQRARLAVVTVSNDVRHNNQVMQRVLNRIESRHRAWQVLDYSMGEVY